MSIYLYLSTMYVCMYVPHRGAVVTRDPSGQWCVTQRQFSYRIFPPYCGGFHYVISGDLIPSMFDAATEMPMLWLEDVIITGRLYVCLSVSLVCIYACLIGLAYLPTRPDSNAYF